MRRLLTYLLNEDLYNEAIENKLIIENLKM